MRTDTAYGHTRPPHPRRFAVLVHAGGCWFPGCFWRWPVAVYARSRVTAALSVLVCTAETAQATLRIGPHPAQVDLCVFFGHMHVAVCAGWGALRGTGVDAHAVRACVLIVQIARAALVRTAVQCVRVFWAHARGCVCWVCLLYTSPSPRDRG